LLLIDTAGIRRKSKISLTLEKYSVVQALKSINRCDIALVLIDAEDGLTDQDTKIIGLAYERGKACIIVVNKWDKIEKDNSTVGKFVEDPVTNKSSTLLNMQDQSVINTIQSCRQTSTPHHLFCGQYLIDIQDRNSYSKSLISNVLSKYWLGRR
jgi:small GTP-binding protein